MARLATDNAGEVTRDDRALLRGQQAAPSRDWFRYLTKLLLTLIGFLIPRTPVKVVYTWHKTHLELLIRILEAATRIQPIDAHVSSLRRNIEDYRSAVESTKRYVLGNLAASPATPAQGLMLLFLRADPAVAAAYDDYLDTYELAANLSVAVSDGLHQQGIEIERTTYERLPEVRAKIEAMPIRHNVDRLLQQRLMLQADLIYVEVSKNVSASRASSAVVMRFAQEAASKARQASRLREPAR